MPLRSVHRRHSNVRFNQPDMLTRPDKVLQHTETGIA